MAIALDLHSIAEAPYTIKRLFSHGNSATYLIREHDQYGEYPNIWAKVYELAGSREKRTIILTDTGTGLNKCNSNGKAYHTSSPASWNIATFLQKTLDPGCDASYIVVTSHCHYDHIMGIQSLLNVGVDLTVLTSSHRKSWVTPYHNLQKHSLCDRMSLQAPKYDARWIEDASKISYHAGTSLLETSITVIHTPGHTPDSLSLYDAESNTLSVGDMFYEKESDETRSGSGKWKREPPMPVMFGEEGNIIDWNASMHRVLDFVRAENRRLEISTATPQESYKQTGIGSQLDFTEHEVDEEWAIVSTVTARRRAVLCAAHVTVAADAEIAILDMLAFMFRVQLDQVPRKRIESGSSDLWLWDDALDTSRVQSPSQAPSSSYRYSIQAPWSVVHPGVGAREAKVSTRPGQSEALRTMLRTITAGSVASLKSNVAVQLSQSSAIGTIGPSRT